METTYKISKFTPTQNSLPINILPPVQDVWQNLDKAYQLLAAMEGKLFLTPQKTRESVVNIMAIVLPPIYFNDICFNSCRERYGHEIKFEIHHQPFIAMVAKNNWIAIELNRISIKGFVQPATGTLKSNPALNPDDLCKAGLHFVRGGDRCVNCKAPVIHFAEPNTELHPADAAILSQSSPSKESVAESATQEPAEIDSDVIFRKAAKFIKNRSKGKNKRHLTYAAEMTQFAMEISEWLVGEALKEYEHQSYKLKKMQAECADAQAKAIELSIKAEKLQDEAIKTIEDYGRATKSFIEREKNLIQMTGLTINEFASINLQRCDAIPPEGFGGHADWRPSQWTNAVAGEAGEGCNWAKKFDRDFPSGEGKEFDDGRFEVYLQNIAYEMADTIIYALIAIKKLGHDPETLLVTKFNEVSDRIGSSIKIT